MASWRVNGVEGEKEKMYLSGANHHYLWQKQDQVVNGGGVRNFPTGG